MPKNILARKTDLFIVARLRPGDDLKKSILALQKKFKIQAGAFVSVVGSLRIAEIRLAEAKKTKTISGPFEILSLNGTIGTGGVHCHITIADKYGRTLGGHLMDGCMIHTTCELVICLIKKLKFTRTLDSTTGYKELRF